MKRRWLLLVILLALAIPAAVYAATVFTRTIPSSVEIVAPGPGPQANLQVFSNPGASQEITALTWGPVMAGTAANKTVWVKNTGGLAYVVVNIATDLNPAAGSLTANSTGFSLATGAVREVVLTLTLQGGATPGLTNFNTDFVGTTQ